MTISSENFKTQIIETETNFNFNVYHKSNDREVVAGFSNPTDFLDFMSEKNQYFETEFKSEILELVK